MRRGFVRYVAGLVGLVLLASLAGCGSSTLQTPAESADQARDEAAKAGVLAIQTGLKAYVAEHQVAPPQAGVAELGGYVNPWPTNPWTDAPMSPGSAPGDYTYRGLGGAGYSLVGHLSSGEPFSP